MSKNSVTSKIVKNVYDANGRIIKRNEKIEVGSYRWIYQKMFDENLISVINMRIPILHEQKKKLFEDKHRLSKEIHYEHLQRVKYCFKNDCDGCNICEYDEDENPKYKQVKSVEKEIKKINVSIGNCKRRIIDKIVEMKIDLSIDYKYDELDTNTDSNGKTLEEEDDEGDQPSNLEWDDVQTLSYYGVNSVKLVRENPFINADAVIDDEVVAGIDVTKFDSDDEIRLEDHSEGGFDSDSESDSDD